MTHLIRWFVLSCVLVVLLIIMVLLRGRAMAAEDIPATLFPSNGLTILRPAPNVGVVYDQFGNTATIFDQRGGMSWYSTEDRHGHITSQGYLFDPFRKREPLMPSVPYVPYNQRGVRR